MSVFDVAEQLRESVDLAEWQWREKELTIELDVRPMEYFGNGKLLRQVWLNLLTNGIRYTGQGGMIKIRNRIHKNNVIVSFTDNGIGIDAEHIPHLFERFYKVDKARTRTEDSTGLGLSIVKEIVEMHDGFIEVESKRNQGTTFTIYLPQK
ncbi:sensor histidine kinase [Paracerasibacillus soli]|uniref:histidine kinase n=1 Tax=Paracerasibacillus soli TaxID=480284 RepID=A0ABU5CV50_9BACI|nr:ATP-binding protein [Virgibacillus soli]MDY0410254.1 ATP-binding protein [Virgibacillus soli]